MVDLFRNCNIFLTLYLIYQELVGGISAHSDVGDPGAVVFFSAEQIHINDENEAIP